MGKNWIKFGNQTLIDLRNDTVATTNLLRGFTAHDRGGDPITGTVDVITYYTGTSAPSANLGNDGDIYLKTVS